MQEGSQKSCREVTWQKKIDSQQKLTKSEQKYVTIHVTSHHELPQRAHGMEPARRETPCPGLEIGQAPVAYGWAGQKPVSVFLGDVDGTPVAQSESL